MLLGSGGRQAAWAPPVQILYLIGCGRSGSTLLSRLLEHEGFRAIGETAYLTEKPTLRLPCGCGLPHESCPLWGPILGRMQSEHTRQAWRLATRSKPDRALGVISPTAFPPRYKQALETVHEVYRSLAVDGVPLVDESKTPWLGYLLATQPWAQVRFVEIVRSPIAVIDSWQREKNWIDRRSREQAAKQWLWRCLTSDAVRLRTDKPWLRRSFTHLVNEPERCLSEIIGREQTVLNRDGEKWQFESPLTHIFRSNPDKLRRGPEFLRSSPDVPAHPSPESGRWEKAACRYWNSRLAARVDLTRDWSAAAAAA